MPYPINQAGVSLLHERETFVGHAYPDPYSALGKALRSAGRWREYLRAPFAIPASMRHLSGAPWTVGWGFTRGVKEGDRMSRSEADARLAAELREYAAAVRAACVVPTNENELAAMVVLAYNIGIAGFQRSTVLRAHNRGDKAAAARAFRLWNKAAGEVSPGLESRRIAEAALYLRPVPGAVETAMVGLGDAVEGAGAPSVADADPVVLPQQVDPERPMAASSINRAGVVAGGTAAVATVAETARTVADVKYSAQSLGDWLVPVLLLAVVALCGYIVWERVKQRKGGWA